MIQHSTEPAPIAERIGRVRWLTGTFRSGMFLLCSLIRRPHCARSYLTTNQVGARPGLPVLGDGAAVDDQDPVGNVLTDLLELLGHDHRDTLGEHTDQRLV